MYHFDPEPKAQSSVWLFPEDTLPLKFKRSRSTSKQMVASYIAKTGYITTIPRRLVCASMPPPSAACCTYPTSKVWHHPSSRQCPCPHCCSHQGVPRQRGCPADVSSPPLTPPPPSISHPPFHCSTPLKKKVNPRYLRGDYRRRKRYWTEGEDTRLKEKM